jgi:prepilin-type N-terminal cleavage/methylation domain-containing protein
VRVVARLKRQEGMTLIELLIAMTIMAVGVTGLVAGLGSGLLSIGRAAKTSTAGAFADQQMEAYRRLTFDAIATDTASTSAAASAPDGVYGGDSAYNVTYKITATCPGSPLAATYYYCNPSRSASANGTSYRIDSYVAWSCGVPGSSLGPPVSPSTVPTCSTPSGEKASRSLKQVTVVVRDGSDISKTLIRATSTFDASTG